MSRFQRFAAVLAAIGVLGIGMREGVAADYPSRPVQLLVGFGPGGGVDLFARRMAQKLTEKWGQPVVVVNRPGADASIAAEFVAHAAPDGYTLLMASNAHAIPPVGAHPGYDPVRSFAPVILAATNGAVLLIHPSVPASSVKELVALAKSEPGKLNFGNPGVGGTPFMASEAFIQRTGIDMVAVPFTGGGPALVSLLSGEIQVLFGTISGAGELVKAGKVRALAVSTITRSASMPDWPTIAEAGDLPGFDVTGWFGILAPAGTPGAIVDKIHDDTMAVLQTPDIQSALAKDDYKVVGSSSQEFARFIGDQMSSVAEILKGMKQP